MAFNAFGTTKALFLEEVNHITTETAKSIWKDTDYFTIQADSGWVVFKGSIFDNVKKFVVVSKVNPNSEALGNQLKEVINEPRQVVKNGSTSLGLSKNLITCCPASMDSVTIKFDFLIDHENKAAQMIELFNNQSIQKLLSLTPVGTAAGSIGGATAALRNVFFPDTTNKPILQFVGEWDILARELKEGYYAILASYDKDNPLPSYTPRLTYDDKQLKANCEPITKWSYILLQVHRIPARGLEHGKGRHWYVLHDLVEKISQDVQNNVGLSKEERNGRFNACLTLLDEMQDLLHSDADYLRWEAQDIYLSALTKCRDKILGRALPEKEESPAFAAVTKRLSPLGIHDEQSLQRRVLNYDSAVRDSVELEAMICPPSV